MAFVVVIVISRVKAKRKAERKKRRLEMREKKERRERRLAAKAVRAATVHNVRSADGADERRGSAATGSTQSRTRPNGEGGYDSASSMTDSEHADAGSSRRPSGSGTTSTTVRLAKQRALVAAVEDNVAAPTRAGRAKKRFGWTSAVNTISAGNAGAISTARLGDPRRVWGWKKGLRRRRGGDREGEQEETRPSTRPRPRSERTEGGLDATQPAEEQSAPGDRAVSAVTSSVLESSPSTLRSSALHSGEEAGETSSGDVGVQPTGVQPDTSTTNEESTERTQVSAFPPAYYRAPSAGAGPSRDGEGVNGRVTEGGPSARAMEKRPMPGIGYDDYFPAPTTEEQEEAVNIAYSRNVASAPLSGDASTRPEAHLAGAEGSGAIVPVPTGAGGHVATDDKQVLERLRLAGSAPPITGDAIASDADRAPISEGQRQSGLQASAPELQVDEDGFERLDELLPPSEVEHVTAAATSIPAASSSILPLPPVPIAQRSLAYARPSSPPGTFSSPVIASAPSAPYDDQDHVGLDDEPSAPPLDIETFDAAQQPTQMQPEPSAPGPEMPQEERRSTEEGEEITLSRRFTVPHRTLGIDLPSDLSAPPAFPHPEDAASAPGAAPSTLTNVGAPRYLPRYEP